MLAFLAVNSTETDSRVREVLSIFQGYLDGLSRTPSVDTVPAWMEGE